MKKEINNDSQIRKDLEEVACIWLDSNIETHNFISESYWRRNFQIVKEMFLDTEVYVFEKEGVIQGFVGVMEDYIAGIFVESVLQDQQGIGEKVAGLCEGQEAAFDIKCISEK